MRSDTRARLKRQTMAERYENSVFRLTPCTVICLVATTARCFVRDQHDRSFPPAASTVDGYSSSDAALSECCATWYTWLRACEAWWTSRCNMLARHYTLHLHMCPIIAPQDPHWPGRRALTFARARDLCLACSADLSLGTGSTSATLLSVTCCRLYVVTKVVRSYVDRVSERFV